MEIIILTGIQATGKSEFYKRNFCDTHIRLNLDMLKTRNREKIIFEACLTAKQPLVIDNTNLTMKDRKIYIEKAQIYGFKVIGYYFKSIIEEAIKRNDSRAGKEKLPLVAIRSAHMKLERPSVEEGFNKLYYVHIDKNEFIIEDFRNEI